MNEESKFGILISISTVIFVLISIPLSEVIAQEITKREINDTEDELRFLYGNLRLLELKHDVNMYPVFLQDMTERNWNPETKCFEKSIKGGSLTMCGYGYDQYLNLKKQIKDKIQKSEEQLSILTTKLN